MDRGSTLLREGRVQELTIGRLNRETSAVVRSVEDGERLIVTRHGWPQAVVLSVADCVELLVEPALARLADDARADYESGATSVPWPYLRPYRVRLARAADAQYRRVGGPDRRAIRRTLGRGLADEARPLHLPTGRWLAPFSYLDENVALVHDFIDARKLRRALMGEEIFMQRRRRNIDRLAHARA